ncbi:LEC14B protein [Sphaceloma murrayae]|uniref:LEC14B protein n=1 Tax=Sphaceloma murrayae TaxID=2082308 RepID=A0A2K1QXA7_9PEZI|nr:LEC14B protein [Sphaceloma murrayae]
MSTSPERTAQVASRSTRSTAEELTDSPWEDADDDDMDYQETDSTTGDENRESEIEIEFQDVTDEFESGDSRETTEERSGDNDDAGEATEQEEQGTGTRRTVLTLEDLQSLGVTQRQLLQLLGGAGVRGLFANHGLRVQIDDDNDDDDDSRYGAWGRRIRRRRPTEEFRWPSVPNPEGQKLIEEGVFGMNEPKRDTVVRRQKKVAYRTMMRELGLETPSIEKARRRLLCQEMIPSAKPDMSINFQSRGYSGQFSDDGNFFFTCSQDFFVRMYDTSNPYRWKYYKEAPFYGGQWTITDATLSPDNKFLAYSSIRPQVCLANTDPENTSDPQSLDFANLGPGQRSRGGRYGHWGIWSLRFSGDGREVVAGTSDSSIYVYDMEAGHSVLRIPGHNDDVNAVCYGDKSSPHILYSGSDDCTIKVWDRRSLGDGREAGVFLGHTEGLTYIDSKGDGRYVISNAKDQTMKLWDLRKMIPPEQAEKINPMAYSSGWDYRYPPYDETERRANPHDCSLVTFRGHSVASTLIRCHFSPPGSTDGRYVYSGSHDGCIYIWNMDGSLKSQLRVSDMRGAGLGDSRTTRILRDVSWHPFAPVIATTSWNGGAHNSGTTTVHAWNDGLNDDEGNPPMGVHVNAELEEEPRRARQAVSHLRTRAMNRRLGLEADSGDDEDTIHMSL